jgi:hypothetical protein
MAIVDALSKALTAQKSGFTFDSLATSRVALSTGAISVPTTSSSKVFSLPASKSALDKAVAGARSVLDTLTEIGARIAAAGSGGRIGLQVEIERLTGRIDDTVKASGDDEINLIGDPSTTYRLRSSTLGGSLTMVSQPLDSRSLGLDGLDVGTQDGIEAARAAVGDAIRTATARFRVLSEAAADLPVPGSVSDSLVSSLQSLIGGGLLTGATGADARASATGTNTLGRGAVVNFQA